MIRRWTSAPWILLLPAVLLPAAASAWNYHPLVIGNTWSYENDLGETQFMEITGEFTVLGAVCFVRRQIEPDQTYSNYWTRDSLGNLYLHGARNDGSDWHVAYDPPLILVSAPLYMGKSWGTGDFEVIHLDGERGPVRLPGLDLRVSFEGDVDTPAGVFYSYGLAFTDPPTLLLRDGGGVFDLYGRKVGGVSASREDILEWWSENLGLSQQTPYAAGEHPLKLLEFIGETAISPSSWGQLKALY